MSKEMIVDLGERVIMALLGATFFVRFLYYAPTHPHLWLVILSEALAVGFIVFRPLGQHISVNPLFIVLGFLGTCFPMIAKPIGVRPEFVSLASLVMIAGLMLSIAGMIALNRRFGIVAANRGVQQRGPFAWIRHPIYAGYTLTHIGFLIVNPLTWNMVVYAAALSAQVARIFAEEAVLRQDQAYRDYASRVRYRLMPKLF